MSLINVLELPLIGDGRGALVPVEAEKSIPFQIKRVYYIFGTQPGVSRGYHSHINLQQLAICVSGKCRMLFDDGSNRESVWLDKPNQALLIGKNIWHEMHDFSEDCVLLVLASEHYDESDYIRDYELFRRQAKS